MALENQGIWYRDESIREHNNLYFSLQGSEVTAYDIASIEGHFEVCEELQKHGYQPLAPPTEVNPISMDP